jgi:hypothetical protein
MLKIYRGRRRSEGSFRYYVHNTGQSFVVMYRDSYGNVGQLPGNYATHGEAMAVATMHNESLARRDRLMMYGGSLSRVSPVRVVPGNRYSRSREMPGPMLRRMEARMPTSRRRSRSRSHSPKPKRSASPLRRR